MNNHWTLDEDLLERFVLERLERTEAATLEVHLKECSECRGRVEAERALIAGIRRAGRDELKQKLRARIGTEANRAVSWQTVFSAAAVVVIAVGIAIYTFVLPTKEPVTLDRAEQSDLIVEGEGQAVAPVAKDESLGMKMGKRDAAGEISSERREDAKKVTKQEPSPATASKAQEAFAGEIQQAAGPFWVAGEVVREADVDAMMEDAVLEKRTLSESARRKPLAITPTPRWRDTVIVNGDTLVVILIFKELTQLPEQQQSYRRLANVVPTEVRSDGRNVTMTIYWEGKEPELPAGVRVEEGNTLVVMAGNQTLRYKLPFQQNDR